MVVPAAGVGPSAGSGGTPDRRTGSPKRSGPSIDGAGGSSGPSLASGDPVRVHVRCSPVSEGVTGGAADPGVGVPSADGPEDAATCDGAAPVGVTARSDDPAGGVTATAAVAVGPADEAAASGRLGGATCRAEAAPTGPPLSSRPRADGVGSTATPDRPRRPGGRGARVTAAVAPRPNTSGRGLGSRSRDERRRPTGDERTRVTRADLASATCRRSALTVGARARAPRIGSRAPAAPRGDPVGRAPHTVTPETRPMGPYPPGGVLGPTEARSARADAGIGPAWSLDGGRALRTCPEADIRSTTGGAALDRTPSPSKPGPAAPWGLPSSPPALDGSDRAGRGRRWGSTTIGPTAATSGSRRTGTGARTIWAAAPPGAWFRPEVSSPPLTTIRGSPRGGMF